MIPVDHEPSPLDLKLFGVSLSGSLAAIGALVWFKTDWSIVPIVCWGAAVLLCCLYYANPGWQRPLFRGWLTAMFPVAWLMSSLILGILYFGLFTPIGWLSRLAGRDPLQLQRPSGSRWRPREGGTPPRSRYFRQH